MRCEKRTASFSQGYLRPIVNKMIKFLRILRRGFNWLMVAGRYRLQDVTAMHAHNHGHRWICFLTGHLANQGLLPWAMLTHINTHTHVCQNHEHLSSLWRKRLSRALITSNDRTHHRSAIGQECVFVCLLFHSFCAPFRASVDVKAQICVWAHSVGNDKEYVCSVPVVQYGNISKQHLSTPMIPSFVLLSVSFHPFPLFSCLSLSISVV